MKRKKLRTINLEKNLKSMVMGKAFDSKDSRCLSTCRVIKLVNYAKTNTAWIAAPQKR